MAEKINHFRELRVYQTAFNTSVEVCEIVKSFPPEERFALTDQMRRASRSVCACVGEAWRRRRYEAAFVAKLNEAETEAAEVQVHLQFAHAHRYIDQPTFSQYDDIYDAILGQLVRMIDRPEVWVLHTDQRNGPSPRRRVAASPGHRRIRKPTGD